VAVHPAGHVPRAGRRRRAAPQPPIASADETAGRDRADGSGYGALARGAPELRLGRGLCAVLLAAGRTGAATGVPAPESDLPAVGPVLAHRRLRGARRD